MIDRRAWLAGAVALSAGPAFARPQTASTGATTAPLNMSGRFVQGGFAIGRTAPGAMVFVDGEALATASETGLFIVGFDRDAPASALIEARSGGRTEARLIDVATGRFPSSRIDGLPPSTVEPTDPSLLSRIRRETLVKAEAFASRRAGDDFRHGFAWPLDSYRISSAWGAQRILNGTPARPHYGIDLAAPQGTVIRAPASGQVVLARPGLHFEGGLTLIDHGQGLISAYLHQSAIDVRDGDWVFGGQAIGRVGRTGRATGPHLCWRLKWRDRNLDPSLLIGAAAPPAT